MKTLLERAQEAFDQLSKQLDATVVFKELGPHQKGSDIGFNKNQAHTETLYLWDSKHGMSLIDWKWSGPSIGWTILQASVKRDKTRFSFMAIHQKTDRTLIVYKTTMVNVKMWAACYPMGLYENYDADTTSRCGVSGSV